MVNVWRKAEHKNFSMPWSMWSNNASANALENSLINLNLVYENILYI